MTTSASVVTSLADSPSPSSATCIDTRLNPSLVERTRLGGRAERSELGQRCLGEVGIFGREGMSASFLPLGTDQSPLETFMQVPGKSGLRIAVAGYLDAVGRSETLRTVMLR